MMRATFTWVALAATLLGGCKTEQATPPGAVKLMVEFEGFRPACVRVSAWDAEAAERTDTTQLRPEPKSGPLQEADKRGTLSVAVFRGEDWGRTLKLRAEGFEKGACDEAGQVVAGREPVAVAESDGVVTQDGKTTAPVTLILSALDVDGDGYVKAQAERPGSDCDDASAASYPGAPEVCDGLDNNCDAARAVDEGFTTSAWYRDEDGDGFGTDASRVDACRSPGTGYVAQGGDCQDGPGGAAIRPGATEVCDDRDNNCDNQTDEGFEVGVSCTEGNVCGQWACSGGARICNGPPAEAFYPDFDGDTQGRADGVLYSCSGAPADPRYVRTAGDCDDGDPFTRAGASEICDGRDNDCDPGTDEAGVCPSGGGSFAPLTTGSGTSFHWRAATSWGNGGVWMVGEAGNWARRAAGQTGFTTGTCGGSTIWYSIWIDARSGSPVYYGGTNRRLAIQAQDSTSCSTNLPVVASAFTTRGLQGFPQSGGAVRIHGVGTVDATTGNTFVWDGSNTTVPLSATPTLELRDAHGISEDTLFAVAEVQSGQFPIYRYNASTGAWEQQTGPAGVKSLLGVHVVNSRLAYAVGEAGTVLKWDGTSWQAIPADANGPGTGTLRAVLAFGESTVYVVSGSGTVSRYNGKSWETLLSVGTDVTLFDVAGTRPDDIWVVGALGRVYHWPQ